VTRKTELDAPNCAIRTESGTTGEKPAENVVGTTLSAV
jgi:hypothetical protein